MSDSLPASTGLADGRHGPRAQRRIAWTRQAVGIYRAAARARLVPSVLAGRFYWLLAVQAILPLIAAWALHQSGEATLPPETGQVVAGLVILLLVLHVLARLGGLLGDVLRDVDEQVLDSLEASPLPSSAYVAGRLAFHVTEQGIGFATLLPSLALAHALRGLELRDLAAIVVALFAVSLTFGLASIGRVLRAHARRPRGAGLPPNLRPGAGSLVALALLGAGVASALLAWSVHVLEPVAPLALAFALTPAMPIVNAADASAVQLFGKTLPVWLLTTGWLLLIAPLAAASARLRWKPPVRASGWDLRLGFLLAWLVPVLVLSGSWRPDPVLAAGAFLLVAAFGAVLPPAWAAGNELSDVGDRPGAKRLLLISQSRRNAAAWAWLLQALTLALLTVLAPAAGPVGRGAWALLALVALAGTTPAVACSAALARVLRAGRGSALVVFLVFAVAAAMMSALPELLAASRTLPVVGPVAAALEGPASLLAAASPFVLLPEAADGLLGLDDYRTWIDVPAPWNLGLPDWACGTLASALLGLPLALVLSRWARARGR